MRNRSRNYDPVRHESYGGGQPGNRQFSQRDRQGRRNEYRGERPYFDPQRAYGEYNRPPYDEVPYRETRSNYYDPVTGLRFDFEYPDSEQGFDLHHEDDRSWWDRAADEVSSWFGDEEATRRRRMDEQNESHRGRGPKNYMRADARIAEDINDRLTDHPYIDAYELEVSVSDGDVTLSGSAESRYDKRLAEDIAYDVAGVKNVENRIRIEKPIASSIVDTESDRQPMHRSRSA